MAWDVGCWVGAAALVILLRYAPQHLDEYFIPLLVYILVAVALQTAFSFFKLGRFRNASFDEIVALSLGTLATGLLAALSSWASAVVAGTDGAPVMLWIVVPPLALTGKFALRAGFRLYRQNRHEAYGEQEPLLIVGAGDAGEQLARLIRTDQNSPYKVVGFLDDNPMKANLSIGGARVRGTIADLEKVIDRTETRHVAVAISNATSEMLSDLVDRTKAKGVNLMTLPPTAQILGGRVQLRDMRQVTIDDVLGRREVQTDLSEISGFITSRRVLVTGAGGSIGAEIARQVHRLGPSELVLLDRDESALHGVQLDIYEKGLLDTRDMALCDIRDLDALREIFEEHKPEIVFHAAALKHLPLLELYPEEGWKTNVIGTRNLLQLAHEYGVGTFVNISTDKAADPTTVLGRSKRLAEQLTASMSEMAGEGSRYVSVRFGNVLGSRGSVLWTFRHQIEQGGPVTITHPDVERYFMTIPEACQLVIQAGAIGSSGEVLVLDMGRPVKILEVAERMIAESGQDIDIVFTGLRPGEKLSEVLVGQGEDDVRPRHPLISHIAVPSVTLEDSEGFHDEVTQEDGVLYP